MVSPCHHSIWLLLSASTILWPIIITNTVLFQSVTVQAYPLIAQVPEQAKKCFKFNIPEDDDAHLVFLAVPMGEEIDKDSDGKLEGWLVQEVYEMTNKRKENGDMAQSLLNPPPSEIKDLMNAFIEKKGDITTKLKVVVSLDANNPASRVLPIKFFAPTVINKVRESHKKIQNEAEKEAEGDDDEADLSGFGVCFDNTANEESSVQVVMDIVMLNAEPEEESKEPNFVKEKHLSPLEESLDKSIRAANTVLREMKYMTDREERMRVTADSINQRVQYFSIFSVVILLAVTYVQVTYLKRYFKKKKLM